MLKIIIYTDSFQNQCGIVTKTTSTLSNPILFLLLYHIGFGKNRCCDSKINKKTIKMGVLVILKKWKEMLCS